MSESRSLIVRALSRLIDLDEAARTAESASSEASEGNGAAPPEEESTPILELSEDALLRALEDAAQSHTSQENETVDAGPVIDLSVEDELEPEETTVDAALEVPPAEPPVGESDGASNGAVVQVGVAPTPSEPTPEPTNGAAPIPTTKPPPADADAETLLLHNTLEGLKNVSERDEIARVVLDYAQSLFGRAALFVIKREMVAGWEGVGSGMTQKTIRAILIPLSTPSVFKTVYETKVLYYGGVPHTTVNDLFLNAVGSKEAPPRIIALPFVLKGKVVCALYADGGQADDLSPRMIGQLYQLGRAVSGAFEQLILRAKRR